MKLSLNTGRLCSAGSGATRYPASSLLFGPPTPTSPSASALVTPRSRPTSADASSFAGPRGPAAACLHPIRTPRSGTDDRLPVCPDLSKERSGSPRCLGRPLHPCHGHVPRRCFALSPYPSYVAFAFRTYDPLGTGNRQFRGWNATAHMLAHLRIAGVVTSTVARLATDLAGYSLVGRVSHPLDDSPNFVATAWFYSFRTSLAWSQRTRARARARARLHRAIRAEEAFCPEAFASSSIHALPWRERARARARARVRARI